MSLSNINNYNKINSNSKSLNNRNINNTVLNVSGNEVVINKKRLKKVAKGLAKFAFLTGETNDEEKYLENIENDLFEALELLRKKRNRKN